MDNDLEVVYDAQLTKSTINKIHKYIDTREERGLEADGPGVGWGAEQFATVAKMFEEFYPGENLGVNEVCKFTLEPELLKEILDQIPFIVTDPEENLTIQIGKETIIVDKTYTQFSILPHKDWGRKVSLFYLVSKSGPETNFYDGPEEPDAIIAWKQSSLDNKRSYTIENGKWYLFNNSHIHEILHILKDRRSLVVPILRLEHDLSWEDMDNMAVVANAVRKIDSKIDDGVKAG